MKLPYRPWGVHPASYFRGAGGCFCGGTAARTWRWPHLRIVTAWDIKLYLVNFTWTLSWNALQLNIKKKD